MKMLYTIAEHISIDTTGYRNRTTDEFISLGHFELIMPVLGSLAQLLEAYTQVKPPFRILNSRSQWFPAASESKTKAISSKLPHNGFNDPKGASSPKGRDHPSSLGKTTMVMIKIRLEHEEEAGKSAGHDSRWVGVTERTKNHMLAPRAVAANLYRGRPGGT
ncbi:hypothetical protein PRK78_001739 [Emydomyces testavorans]|uniref:Uncharacterized protein n=1 Tax=Emydomyces testavorans TaxID=2070801 RepID=A0AAF0DD03_9EURO|nr:hypothetical protein PRK78_001739 [Emydomyces testavorans]